jgi:hypothetical protein
LDIKLVINQKQILQTEVLKMLTQPFVLEVLANEHQNNLLKEASAHRRTRQVKKERFGLASLLRCMVAFLGEPLIGPVRQSADQTSFFTDEVVTDGSR